MNPPLEPAPSSDPHPGHVFPLRKFFFNEFELRAGWRLLIFFAILMLTPDRVFFVPDANQFARQATSSEQHAPKVSAARNSAVSFPPGGFIVGDGLSLALLIALTAFMSVIERRPMRHYGLPLRQAFRGKFWMGCLWGFAAISAFLLVLRATHSFYFGLPAIHGRAIIRFAVQWGIAFLLVGFLEEFLLRGYAQFTLTLGIGFWPAAFLLSLFFAFMHRTNPGETLFGLFEILLIALFFCFTLWRTGNLWFAVGFHAAWDWSQSFFYGTPDSGILAQGRWLHSSIAGPTWLNGGSVGPEGSVLVAPLIGLLFVLFYFAFPDRAPYPDPTAITPALPKFDPQRVLL